MIFPVRSWHRVLVARRPMDYATSARQALRILLANRHSTADSIPQPGFGQLADAMAPARKKAPLSFP